MNKEKSGIEGLDEHLSQKVAASHCMDRVIEEIQEALQTACRISYRIRKISKKETYNKSVPWWIQRLTSLRKKVNSQRRKFQRTKDNDDLRDHRKEQYLASKAEYAAAMR